MKPKDLKIGLKIRHYTIIEFLEPRKYVGKDGKITCKRMVRCQCDCGRIKSIQVGNLLSKNNSKCRSCSQHARGGKRLPRKFPDGYVNQHMCYKRYIHGANKRNLPFDLTLEEFLEISQKDCYYCGAKPSNVYNLLYGKDHKYLSRQPRGGKPFIYNGLDRIDSNLGYCVDNCVPCCAQCNIAKSNFSKEEFLSWIKRVYIHNNKH